MYVWKILEGLVPDIFPPICTKESDRVLDCVPSVLFKTRISRF